MTDERWHQLEMERDSELTPEEIAEGWHWCHEFDLLLVGPTMTEALFCTCGIEAIERAKPALKALQEQSDKDADPDVPF